MWAGLIWGGEIGVCVRLLLFDDFVRGAWDGRTSVLLGKEIYGTWVMREIQNFLLGTRGDDFFLLFHVFRSISMKSFRGDAVKCGLSSWENLRISFCSFV